jgi:hypothetical protein
MSAIGDNRVSNAMKGVENNNKVILTLRSDVQSSLQQVTKTCSSLIGMLIKEIEASTTLYTRCQEMFHGIHDLLSHHLSPHLVPADVLLNTLQNITQTSQQNYPLFHIVHILSSKYYSVRTSGQWYIHNGQYTNHYWCIIVPCLSHTLLPSPLEPIHVPCNTNHQPSRLPCSIY